MGTIKKYVIMQGPNKLVRYSATVVECRYYSDFTLVRFSTTVVNTGSIKILVPDIVEIARK